MAYWNAHNEAGNFLGRTRATNKKVALAQAKKRFHGTAFVAELPGARWWKKLKAKTIR